MKHSLVELLLVAVPAATQAQVSLSGTIADEQTGRSIQGALVRMSGLVATTDAEGRFRFPAVVPGEHVVQARAVGYLPVVVRVKIRSDTTVAIRAIRQPVVLDTVVVSGRSLTVRGTLVDTATKMVILYGQVTLYPGAAITGAYSGRFRIANIPAGEAVLLSAEAVEYLPKDIELLASRDTSVVIYLAIDSVRLRMTAAQVKRLSDRAVTVPVAVDALNRAKIMGAAVSSVGELVKRRLPSGVVKDRWPYMDPERTCIFLDDNKVDFGLLMGVAPEAVERIEIFGREGRMIRVYSRRFVLGLARAPSLPKVVYSPNGLHQFCS